MAIAIVLIIVTIGSLVFHYASPWWLTPLSSNWSEMDDTLIITFVVTGIVFVAINAFIAYSLIRFRYNKDRKAAYEPENKKLEWWLTGLTSVGIVIMLAPGLLVYGKFVEVPKEATAIEVIGQQWSWSFRFPGDDGVLGNVDPRRISGQNPFGMNPDDPNGQDDILVTGGEMHIPIDKPVQVLLRSKDVLHDFYVPHFRVKMDAVPGVISSLWFTPTKTGRFEIACAEYCGIGHHTMRGVVVVEEEAEALAWLDAQSTYAQTSMDQGAKTDDPMVAKGQQLAQDEGCLGCHSVDGSPGAGPTWKDLYGKTEKFTDGSSAEVDEAYLKESIIEPNAKVVEGYAAMMPAYEFSDEELDAIIAYTIAQASAGDNSGGDSSAAEQGRKLAQDQGCLGCHSVDGSPSVGPTWLGLYGKAEKLVDGSSVDVDDEYLKESIIKPNASVVEGYSPMMPAYEFSEAQLDALIAYTKAVQKK